MELMRKLQKLKAILIAIGITLAVVFVLIIIDFKTTVKYVEDNYIVVSGGKTTAGKQSFVYEYTALTGDSSLADILGINTQTVIGTAGLGGQAFAFNEKSDLRGLAKAVASAWIIQGGATSGKLEVGERAVTAYQDLQAYSGDAKGLREMLTSSYGFTGDSGVQHNLYNSQGGSRTYAVNTMLGVISVNTCRCCCCLSESMVQCLVNTEYSTSLVYKGVKLQHVASVGLNSDDKENFQYSHPDGTDKTYQIFKSPNTQDVNGKTRAVGEGLWGLSSSTTINDLIQQNKIGIGTILMWVSDDHEVDNIYNHPSHIAMVVYMDDQYIYTAGAGSSKNIMADAILGYDGKHERTSNIYQEFDTKDSALSNIIFWTESSIVDGK